MRDVTAGLRLSLWTTVVLPFLFAIPLVSVCAKDWEPSPLERMIGQADLILEGAVTRVGETTITVAVDRFLGDRSFEGGELEIVKYEIWDYSPPRPAEYSPGERFIWLLSFRPEAGVVGAPPKWRVFGQEGEGELPVEAGRVHFRPDTFAWLETVERELHGRNNRKVQPFSLSLFWDAATDYRRCFRWPAVKGEPVRPQTVCPEEELQAYSGRSLLHLHLAAASRGQ